MIPGVPAAGHVTSSGFWHPGRIDGCAKCPAAVSPLPRRGSGSAAWDYICGARWTAGGPECALRQHHDGPHVSDDGSSWSPIS